MNQQDLRKLLEGAIEWAYASRPTEGQINTYITYQLEGKGDLDGIYQEIINELESLIAQGERNDIEKSINNGLRMAIGTIRLKMKCMKEHHETPQANQPTGWIELKEGNPLPDYDEPALWLSDDGCVHVDSLDKDGNPEIFEGYLLLGVGPLIKTTHWMKMPPLPPHDSGKEDEG